MYFGAHVLGPEVFFFGFFNLPLAILREAGAQTLPAFYRRTKLPQSLFFSVRVKTSLGRTLRQLREDHDHHPGTHNEYDELRITF